MPALNYHRRFAADVRSGKKRQTIREMRNRPFRIGDTLYHWVDQRSPNGRRIRIDKCRMAIQIEIVDGNIYLGEGSIVRLGADERLALARADGFRSVDEMLAWIEKAHGTPFVGQLIMW